jgi:hypothetical protein
MNEERIIRIKLRDELFRKYKVYCAIENISMTEMTNIIVSEYINKQQENVKIFKVEKK